MNLGAWGLLMVLFVIFHRAKPEFETFFDRFQQLKVRTEWDLNYIYVLMQMVSVSLVICLAGLLLSRYRGRRRTDPKRALFITGITALIMLITAIVVLK